MPAIDCLLKQKKTEQGNEKLDRKNLCDYVIRCGTKDQMLSYSKEGNTIRITVVVVAKFFYERNVRNHSIEILSPIKRLRVAV